MSGRPTGWLGGRRDATGSRDISRVPSFRRARAERAGGPRAPPKIRLAGWLAACGAGPGPHRARSGARTGGGQREQVVEWWPRASVRRPQRLVLLARTAHWATSYFQVYYYKTDYTLHITNSDSNSSSNSNSHSHSHSHSHSNSNSNSNSNSAEAKRES